MPKLTIQEVKDRIYESYGESFVLHSKEYLGANYPIELKCTKCGWIKKTNMNAVKSQPTGCAKCKGLVKKTAEDVSKLIHELTSGEYELLGEFNGVDTPMKIRHNCDDCNNNEYNVTFSNFKKGTRCPECAKVLQGVNKTKSSKWKDRFVENVKEFNYEIISNELKRKKDKIEINNKNCNHESFLMSPDKFERGQRCPKCLRSTGEEEIAKVLSKNNLRYIEQKRFDDLVYKKRLSFDFAVIDNKNKIIAMIEFDGEQHFRAVDFFGGSDNFEKTKLRDSMKNDYCMKNNIQLLRISYLEFENIESIIIKYFKDIIK